METNNFGNVLLVTGHTYEQISVANKLIVEELKQRIPALREDNLARLYPGFKMDVKAEQEKLLWADTIIIQVPFFWFSMPSIVMRWIEEVFTHGWAYGSTGTALKGKKIILGITAGSPTESYLGDAAGLTVEDVNKRYNVTFSFCNMDFKGVVLTGGFLNMGDGNVNPDFLPRAKEHVDNLLGKLNG